MNTQTVSPATARLLADAGFPQPAPAPGQWWGNSERNILVLHKLENKRQDYYTVLIPHVGGGTIDHYFDARDFTGLVYLPTAADVLRGMPGITIGWFPIVHGKYAAYTYAGSFLCSDENYSECAALAWLELNKK